MSDETRNGPAVDARERFFALLEKELADDVELSEEERAFSARMGSADRECVAVAEALSELRREEPIRRDAVDRAVSEHWRAKSDRRRRNLIAASGAAASLAAAAVVAFVLISAPRPADDGSAPARPAFALIAKDGGKGGVGPVFTAGAEPRLLRDLGSLTVGMDRGSGLEVAGAEPSAVSLRLKRGRAAFHLQPGTHRGLTVMTPICDVVVTGTVFSVAVEEDEVRVGVVKGSVSVRNAQGEIARVKAGEKLSVRGRSTESLDANEADAILSLLDMDEIPGAPGMPGAVPGSASSGLGEQASSETSAAGVVVPSQHRRGAEDRKVEIAIQESATPAELIRQARERVKARDWYGAAELYRRIADGFPGRSESVTVRVSLADIELDQLRTPAAALSDYEAYLSTEPNGPLAEDALWGTCSAFSRLGRISEEKRALATFIARFPQSLHAKVAQERLLQLEK